MIIFGGRANDACDTNDVYHLNGQVPKHVDNYESKTLAPIDKHRPPTATNTVEDSSSVTVTPLLQHTVEMGSPNSKRRGLGRGGASIFSSGLGMLPSSPGRNNRVGSMDANRRAALVGTARSLFIFLINNSVRARSNVLKSLPSTKPVKASTINE